MGILTFCDSLTGGALNHVNCQHYVMGNFTKTFQKKLNAQGFSLRGGMGTLGFDWYITEAIHIHVATTQRRATFEGDCI